MGRTILQQSLRQSAALGGAEEQEKVFGAGEQRPRAAGISCGGPLEGGADVVVVVTELVEHRLRLRQRPAWLERPDPPREVLTMPLAGDLEHPVARAPCRAARNCHQRLVDQSPERA